MSTLNEWTSHCTALASTPASFYAGARKIIRPCTLHFSQLDSSLRLSHAGFTTNKLKALTRHYLHEESQRVASSLWEKRRSQENYGSVGFTTYNHLVKGDVTGATPRGSKFGPCIQSVVITHLDKRTYTLDIFYRTTEVFKKFAPDLVLIRDVLLPPFDFSGMTCASTSFHFANLTAHTMYICTLFPLVKDPIKLLEQIKRKDKRFYEWAVKWSARYLCPKFEHGIQKFSQALRVQKDILERLDPKLRKQMQKYLTDNHPGYTRTRFTDEEDPE